mgnify:CR=1 FL=1
MTGGGTEMPELNEACLKLSMLIRNPYAVQRYEQHKKSVQDAWTKMSTQTTSKNGGRK